VQGGNYLPLACCASITAVDGLVPSKTGIGGGVLRCKLRIFGETIPASEDDEEENSENNRVKKLYQYDLNGVDMAYHGKRRASCYPDLSPPQIPTRTHWTTR